MLKWILIAVVSFVGLIILGVVALMVVATIAFSGSGLVINGEGIQWGPSPGDGIQWGDGGTISIGNVEAAAMIEKTLKVNGRVDLTVDNRIGDVVVKTGNSTEEVVVVASVRASGNNQSDAQNNLQQMKVDPVQQGNSITIKPVFPDKLVGLQLSTGRNAVDLEITVPANTTVDVKADLGKVDVSGVNGRVTAKASLGEVAISNVTGAIDVSADLGKVEIKDATLTGNLSVVAKAGDILFQGALGQGYQHTLTANLGAIRLVLPAQSAFSLDARTNLGDINNQFAMSNSSKSEGLGDEFTGTIGSPAGTSIVVRAAMGSISIEKQ
jgi:hypothetical protein